jgi:hypothetical protein
MTDDFAREAMTMVEIDGTPQEACKPPLWRGKRRQIKHQCDNRINSAQMVEITAAAKASVAETFA